MFKIERLRRKVCGKVEKVILEGVLEAQSKESVSYVVGMHACI